MSLIAWQHQQYLDDPGRILVTTHADPEQDPLFEWEGGDIAIVAGACIGELTEAEFNCWLPFQIEWLSYDLMKDCCYVRRVR